MHRKQEEKCENRNRLLVNINESPAGSFRGEVPPRGELKSVALPLPLGGGKDHERSFAILSFHQKCRPRALPLNVVRKWPLRALVFLYAFEESVDCHLLSSFCDDSNLHISLLNYVLSTMGVSKESISKFLIGNRFHVRLRILSPYSNRSPYSNDSIWIRTEDA